MSEPSEKQSVFFAEGADLPETPFNYGWCSTDHKDGKEIRRGYRDKDYMNDEPFATSVRTMLEKLGLPMPKPEEIFRGTHHDLLFLNNHGVVLRIGPTDVKDLMNPGILQPLGWLEDKDIRIGTSGKIPFTVAIYPGIEQYNAWINSADRPESVGGNLSNLLETTGQGSGDVFGANEGIIRILDDDGKEAAVEVLLDSDNEWNGSSGELASKRSEHMAIAEEFHENKGDVMSQTMEAVFGDAEKIKFWKRAFEVHQPLRRLFFDAFSGVKGPDDMPDAVALKKFWDTCAQVTNNPHPAMMPMWHSQKNAAGKTEFVRDEVFVPQVILYRPWTGEKADNVVQPLNVSDELREAVQRQHTAMMQRTMQQAEPRNMPPVAAAKIPVP